MTPQEIQARADAAMVAAGCPPERLIHWLERAERGLGGPSEESRAAARRIEVGLTPEQRVALGGVSVFSLWDGCTPDYDRPRLLTRPLFQSALVALGWADVAMTEEGYQAAAAA